MIAALEIEHDGYALTIDNRVSLLVRRFAASSSRGYIAGSITISSRRARTLRILNQITGDIR